jgi:IS30 family transposase
MIAPGRSFLPPAVTLELWQRWRAGANMTDIARALGAHVSSIERVVKFHGGIPPRARHRAARVLTPAEREAISRGAVGGQTVRQMAADLGRAPSTISRELRRNGGRQRYRATAADARAWRTAQRPKRCRLAASAPLRRVVATKLQAKWSPQQIAGWLTRQYPDDLTMHVSHETIYKSLYIQARGVLKKELLRALRMPRHNRLSQHATKKGQGRSRIRDAVSIHERPSEIETRAVPGHWEGDLIAGARNTHIATLVERVSRFTLLVKVPAKDTVTVTRALTRRIQRLPRALRQSLTWDRGMELAAHKSFTVATDVQVYFCDPQSPWQRGTNENTNRLLRQYFPYGTDMNRFTQAALDRVAAELNARPRKTLDYATPAEVFHQSVALTG